MPQADLDESGREQSTLERVVFGVRIGLGVSVALLILASPFAAMRAISGDGTTPAGSLSLGSLAILYLLGGLFGGAFVGLIWPVHRWWWGRRVLGFVAVAPIMLATGGFLCAGHWTLDWTMCDLRLWLMSALIYGVGVSFVVEKRAKEW